ncbi:hypothetical protein QLX08_009350 [Tetragonisca angustula]|uniref:Endonuclease/exonuclease/phosphatase domain-containing protein n=1 Tax=Tetragonisca angustula TaxID=166442 RepID=A0AAW0ZGN8_9HYME
MDRVSTFYRRRGESVIDLIWATPDIAGKVVTSEVLVDTEILSDHRYVVVDYNDKNKKGLGNRRRPKGARLGGDREPHPQIKRWAVKQICEDKLKAAMQVVLWEKENCRNWPPNEEEYVKWIHRKLREVSDCSMPRVKGRYKTTVYWWNERVKDLRQKTVAARRALQRRRRKRSASIEGESALNQEYWRVTNLLREAIREAKVQAWGELVATLDQDPWGKPYQAVMQKIRTKSAPVTDSCTG